MDSAEHIRFDRCPQLQPIPIALATNLVDRGLPQALLTRVVCALHLLFALTMAVLYRVKVRLSFTFRIAESAGI
jgi:hypothetical protein